MKKSRKMHKPTKPIPEHKKGSQARNEQVLAYLLGLKENSTIESKQDTSPISSDKFFDEILESQNFYPCLITK
jgi:hypothetical protein